MTVINETNSCDSISVTPPTVTGIDRMMPLSPVTVSRINTAMVLPLHYYCHYHSVGKELLLKAVEHLRYRGQG